MIPFPSGGYRFLPGASPFSAGVVADPGFEIARVRVDLPLDEGFRRIEARLKDVGRPLDALCACELRLPAPLSLEGFTAFNRRYVDVLKAWELFKVDGLNPVARVNVCPAVDPPSTPSLHAFAYTVPGPGGGFVVSGVAEVPDAKGSYPGKIVRRGDVSPDGLREKAAFVWAELRRRMSALGVDRPTETRLYTAHPTPAGLPEGLNRIEARPPLLELELELDVRATRETGYT